MSLHIAPGSLLAALSPADRAALLAMGTGRTYPPGAVLIGQDGGDTEVFLLTAGFVRIEGGTADGRTVLLSLRVAGEVVGELAALTGLPRSATVTAATTVTARAVARRRFQDHLAAHPAVAAEVQKAVAAKLRRATRHRLETAGATATARLAAILLHLAEAYGVPGPEGVTVGLPLSQPDLARLVAVSEPSVRRGLADLRGVVRSGYRTQVITDLAALRDVVEGRRE